MDFPITGRHNRLTAANWAGRHPAKRTPPVASSSGCGNLRIASVRGPVGSRGPTGVGRGRTVEAFRVHRAEVGDLPLLQLQPLGFEIGRASCRERV